MKRNVIFLALLIVIGAGFTGKEKQALSLSEIVERAVSKVANAEVLYYKSSAKGVGVMAQFFPETASEIYLVPNVQEDFGTYKQLLITGTEKGAPLKVLDSDGVLNRFQMDAKAIIQLPKYRGAATLFNEKLAIVVAAMADLRKAGKSGGRQGEDQVVNGRPSYVVEYDDAATFTFRFYIDKETFWFTKVEATSSQFGGWNNGSLVMDIESIKALSYADNKHRFDLEIPAGFQVKQFAGNFPGIGSAAPDWTLKSNDGEEIKLADYHGKVLVMDFWATWCAPCIKNIPDHQKLYKELKSEGLEVLGVTYQEKGNPAALLKRVGATYPNVAGDALEESYNLKQSGLPIVYVIDREGKIVDFILGGAEIASNLERIVRKALD